MITRRRIKGWRGDDGGDLAIQKSFAICWGVAKCVHEIGRNKKIEPPHFRFKWCFLCSGGLNMMILDQIIQKKTKTTTKQPKTSTHCFWFLWTGQGTFLVEDFHRPNGAKILRFGNFPETLTYLGSLENCQKSKSFSKIWMWKSWNFGIIFWPAEIFFLNLIEKNQKCYFSILYTHFPSNLSILAKWTGQG